MTKFQRYRRVILLSGIFGILLIGGCSGGGVDESKLIQIAIWEDQATLHDGELLTFLTDDNPTVRRRAALAAARIGDTLAVSALVNTLADPDTIVRARAAFALGTLRKKSATDSVYRHTLTETNSTTLQYLLWTLRRLYAKKYGDSVVTFLQHDDPRVRAQATLYQAGVVNRNATEKVAALLDDPEPMVREYACQALTRLKSPLLADDIAELLDDPKQDVVAAAAMALGNAGDFDYQPLLVQLLDHPNRYVRYGAVMGIGALRDTTRLEDVYSYLRSMEDPGILTQLVFAVGYHWQRSAAPEFEKLLDHPDIGVRVRLADGFMRALQNESLPYLKQLAKDPAWPVRAAVPKQLEFFAQPKWGLTEEATAVVKDLLQDSVPAVRGAAVRSALAFRGAIQGPIQDALNDPDPFVRYLAYNVLPFANGRLTFDSLLTLYKHHQQDERSDMRMAILALTANLSPSVQVGPVQRQIFNAGINDPDRHVRYYAAAVWEKFRENRWDEVGTFETDITAVTYADLYHADTPRPRVRVVTAKGTFVVELFDDAAPRSVRHFLDYVEAGFYDDSPVNPHDDGRTIFIGDRRGDGWGTGLETVRNEQTMRRLERGILYWRINLGHDARSEFGISLIRQPFSDFRWSSFGRVVEGMDVVKRLRPLDRIVRVERISGELALQ